MARFDFSCTCENLSGYKEGYQLRCQLTEIDVPFHQIVFVASVSISGGIQVIFKNGNFSIESVVAHAPFRSAGKPRDNAFTRLIVSDKFSDIIAFRGRVFWVASDVLVESGTVFKKDIGIHSPSNDFAEEIHHDVLNSECLSMRGIWGPDDSEFSF